MSTALVGTAPLLRTSFKHDGRLFAPWIVLATALSASSVLVYPFVFPTQQDRAALAAAIGANPALGLIFGPAYDLTTMDGFNAWRSLALGGFLTGLAAIFTVVRATRGQEDSGQAELLASGVMGRSSRLLSGAGLALIGCLLLGVVAGVVTGLCGGGWESSMLLAATFTATGWMFAAVAAIAAQIGSDARTANSIAVGVLGVLFLLRGFLYSIEAPEWTVWVNPLSWMTATRPASGNHWWPLLLAVGFTAVGLGIAFAVQARRDFGQGAIAPRPGPAHGKDRSTWRLAVRLNRGPIITWTVAFLALGVVFGYFTTSINDIVGSDSGIQQILATGATTPGALVAAFLVTVLSLVGIIAAIPGVQTMLKVRTEEMEDRLEPIIATAEPRPRYYASNVLLALTAPTAYRADRRDDHRPARLRSRHRHQLRRCATASRCHHPGRVDRRRRLGRRDRRPPPGQARRLARRPRLLRPHPARPHLRPPQLGPGHQPVLPHPQRLHQHHRLHRTAVDHPGHRTVPGHRVRRIPTTGPRPLTRSLASK